MAPIRLGDPGKRSQLQTGTRLKITKAEEQISTADAVRLGDLFRQAEARIESHYLMRSRIRHPHTALIIEGQSAADRHRGAVPAGKESSHIVITKHTGAFWIRDTNVTFWADR